MTVREIAESAAKSVMRANAEADELEAEVKAARERAAAAGKSADTERKLFERETARAAHDVEGELASLKSRLERTTGSKAPVRPSPELRGLSRKWLRMGLHYGEIERLASLDPRFSELHGICDAAQNMGPSMFGRDVRDERLYVLLDSVECAAWRAVVARAQVLAGEAAS